MQIVCKLVTVAWRLAVFLTNNICEVTVAVGAGGLSGVIPAGGLDLVCSCTGKECLSFQAVGDSYSYLSVLSFKLYQLRHV